MSSHLTLSVVLTHVQHEDNKQRSPEHSDRDDDVAEPLRHAALQPLLAQLEGRWGQTQNTPHQLLGAAC